jgi:hypothetical protein
MTPSEGASTKGPTSALPRVRSVTPLAGFRVRLLFTDGDRRDVDLEPLLRGPIFEAIRGDPSLFKQVTVDEELGTIIWPNGADIDPDVLHGDFDPDRQNASAGES